MTETKPNEKNEREPWLKGAVEGFSPLLMPAAHALLQCASDISKVCRDIAPAELYARPNGAPSLAFHLRHVCGSLDRLMTYARGEELSETQMKFLRAENSPDENDTAEYLAAAAVGQIEKALQTIRETDEKTLFETRFVGREKIPTNVFGLLFHLAEHTQRHTGQIVTTARIVRKV